MNLRTKSVYICILCVLIALPAQAMGGKEDPIREADTLIAQGNYDEALVYLADFIQNYPQRFDDAQARISNIMRSRVSYNELLQALIKTIEADPSNETKKLAIIKALESFSEHGEAMQVFIGNIKNYALFVSYKEQFEAIMNKGRAFIDAGKFSEAALNYQSGFFLYREEFKAGSFDAELKQKALALADDASEAAAHLSARNADVKDACRALTEAIGAEKTEAVDAAYAEMKKQAEAFGRYRSGIVDCGYEIETISKQFAKNEDTYNEVLFLAFAYRLILGRANEAMPEGITGAVSAAWEEAVSKTEAASEASLKKALASVYDLYQSAHTASDTGAWARLENALDRAEEQARAGRRILETWAPYARTDMLARSTPFGKAALKKHGSLYLRFVQALDALRAYRMLAAVEKRGLPQLEGFAELFDDMAKLNAALSLSRAKGEKARNLAYDVAWSNEQTERVARAADEYAQSAQVSHAQAVFAAYDAEREAISAGIAKSSAAFEKAQTFLDGTPSNNPDLPNMTIYYPSKALKMAAAIQSDAQLLAAAGGKLDAFMRKQPDYIQEAAHERLPKTGELKAAADKLAADAQAMAARAAERKRLADSSRLEAERRVKAARAAASEKKFDEAREQLDRASERYTASLTYEEDAALRVNSDAQLADIAALIVKAENDVVIADTRRLVTQGRDAYMRTDFLQAEEALLQARARWAMTNPSPEFEVEYWLKLAQTALSVKTGRDIPVNAPLFAEMSQLLSLAKRYFDEGSSCLASGDRAGAKKAFEAARQKTAEVKIVFPLNQEARVLELRLDQKFDPQAFEKTFEKMFNEAKAKIQAKTDIVSAYSDLRDLETINPRYSGLQAAIEKAEIVLGIRQAPPDLKAIAEIKALIKAAKVIFDSGQVAQFAFARAQLDKALSLDPANQEAGELKDRIARYIGGTSTLVLPSAAEILYNEAVSFFAGGDYVSSRARLANLLSIYPRGVYMQKVSDLDARLKARGY